jgi:hypothetical protein
MFIVRVEQCKCVYMSVSKRAQWSRECLRALSRDHSSLQCACSQRKELFIVHFLHKADRRHIAKTNRTKKSVRHSCVTLIPFAEWELLSAQNYF